MTVGDVSFEVRHAPGHSPGSVCLVGPGVALSGDVLFAGSIGRTDLPGGDFETLIASIDGDPEDASDAIAQAWDEEIAPRCRSRSG